MAGAVGGEQLVLGEEDGMLGTEAFALGADVVSVAGVGGGDRLPVDLLVARDGRGEVGRFEGVDAAVRGDGLFEEGVAGPGRAEHDRDGAGGCGHRAELAVEPVGIDVLGFVGDEGEGGGVASDVSIGRGAEIGGAGAADGDGGAGEARRGDVPRGSEKLASAVEADLGLRREGGRADDDVPAAGEVLVEELCDEGGADFVLAGLARKHDGEGFSVAVADGAHELMKRVALVIVEVVGAENGRRCGDRHGTRMTAHRRIPDAGTALPPARAMSITLRGGINETPRRDCGTRAERAPAA